MNIIVQYFFKILLQPCAKVCGPLSKNNSMKILKLIFNYRQDNNKLLKIIKKIVALIFGIKILKMEIAQYLHFINWTPWHLPLSI